MGATKEEAPHPPVKVGFLMMGVLSLEVLTRGKVSEMGRAFQT